MATLFEHQKQIVRKNKYRNFVDSLGRDGLRKEFNASMKAYGQRDMTLTEANGLEYLLEAILKVFRGERFATEIQISLNVLREELSKVKSGGSKESRNN